MKTVNILLHFLYKPLNNMVSKCQTNYYNKLLLPGTVMFLFVTLIITELS